MLFEYPWAAGIDRKFNKYNVTRVCTASVINDRMILLAASCLADETKLKIDKGTGYNVYNEKWKDLVILHSHKTKNDKDAIVIEPEDFVIHPGYVDGIRR